MSGRVLRELTSFEIWCEPLFDLDTPRVTKVVEAAAKLEEYAAFALRIMRRAELGKPCPEVDDDGTVLATDEDIIREVVNALAQCRRYFWSAKHEWAKATAKLEAAKLLAEQAEIDKAKLATLPSPSNVQPFRPLPRNVRLLHTGPHKAESPDGAPPKPPNG